MPPPPSPVQPPTISFKRPLVDLSTAMAALDRDRRFIWQLLDEGKLRAFNLGGEIHMKNFLRIVAADIAQFQRGEPRAVELFGDFLKRIFPMMPEQRVGVVRKLKLVTIANRLNVKAFHVSNLVEAGHLIYAPGSVPKRGPGGSAFITCESLEKFLRKRLIQ